jgi:hypothetical protein
MSVTITDPVLLAELSRLRGIIELKDPQGNLIGELDLESNGKLPPGVKSPFTDEQLAELRKQRGGRPLVDILRDLQARQ